MPVRGGAGGAWTPIAETILGAPAAAVTFAAIPGTYRTLVALLQVRTDRVNTNDFWAWRVNGDNAANYDHYQEMDGTGGVITRTSGVAQTWVQAGNCEAATARANCWSPNIVYWEGYARVDREKYGEATNAGMIRGAAAGGDLGQGRGTGHWRNTAAITSVTFYPVTGANFIAGCVFQLYGIT